jgi:PAS domain S-box-containing protein
MTKHTAQSLCDFSTVPRVDLSRLQELQQRTTQRLIGLSNGEYAQEALGMQHSLGFKLARTTKLEDVLFLALEAATSVWSFDSGGIYLWEDGDFVLKAYRGVSMDFVREASRFTRGHPAHELTLRGMPRYILPGDADYNVYEPIFRLTGLRSVAVMPIMDGARVVGSFDIGSRTSDVIPEIHRRTLEVLAFQVNDVVVRVLSTQAREQLLHKYEAFADAVDDAVMVHRGDSVIAVNKAWEKFWGLSEKEAQTLGVVRCFAPESRGLVSKRIIENDLATYEAKVLRRDGSEVPVRVRVKNVKYNGQPEPCRAKVIIPLADA